MRNWLGFSTFLWAIGFGAQASLQLQVALNGSDQGSGSAEAPFRTLEHARDEIRRLKAAGELPVDGAVVTLRAGIYELDRTFELAAQDSGTLAGPIVYRAQPGEQVHLSGGRVLTNWKKVADPKILERLEPAARAQVWASDLRAQGITNFGTMKSAPSWGQSEAGLELFFNDQPMTIARWPNEGTIAISAALGPTPHQEGGEQGQVEGIIAVQTDRLKRWLGEPDVMADGYWFFDWADQRQRVESIDPAKGVLTLSKPYHVYGYRKGQWFYVYNLLSELDRPGEWYLDRDKGVLYFWPPAPLDAQGQGRLVPEPPRPQQQILGGDLPTPERQKRGRDVPAPAQNQAVVSILPRLVNIQNAAHVRLEGFTLEAACGLASGLGELRNAAIAINESTNVVVADCQIRNCGSWGAIIKGGSSNQVVGCDLYQTGDGGVWLEGGERQTLTAGGHVVENCEIHLFSRWNSVYNPAVRLRGVGNRAVHNLIHDAPHMAIDFGGNDHVIEYNEIHRVVEDSNDAGAIYTGRDWSMRGHVIRYNYLHDIRGRGQRGCVGVYLDDCFSSATVFGNIFARVSSAAFIGGGRDCVVANNLFVDCEPALHVDARCLSWESLQSELPKRLKQVPYQAPPWSVRYPQLPSLMSDQPLAPKGNVIATNVCWRGKWADIDKEAEPFLRITNNLLGTDPGFVRAGAGTEAGQFELSTNSPVWKVGFQRIPLERIGMHR
jgi:hypothetical protein